MATISRTVEVAAPPERVWALVSDLPRMGEYSPENTGGRWVKGGGPVVGARFRGTNRQGRRTWSTSATVTRSEPGRAFAFEVKGGPLAVALWSYEITPTATGCTLTESWEDRRGLLLTRTGGLLTGEPDREGYNARSIEQTLARVKARAEAEGGQPST